MKLLYTALALLSLSLHAQKAPHPNEAIAESEMKAASKSAKFIINQNTTNYDITHHKLEFTVNPAAYFISGKVTTTFKALSPMSTVVFDLTDELTVTSVKLASASLGFTHQNDELTITLPTTLATGNTTSVEITYSGEPSTGENAFVTDEHAGTPVLWTLSEPYGARDWWPCKQDLNDKADSIDVYITAPAQYTAVANGIQIGAVTTGANKTTHFRHNYPIPAYLIAIAVTNYSIFTQTAGTAPNQFPIVNYIYPENLTSGIQDLAETLPIMDFFEDTFETYPFAAEKYGHAQFGWGGGMEHTTVSFMGNFNRQLIAHELAHQWFGNKITCGTWKDIWLNEGFATYLASMVIDHLDGEASFINDKGNMIAHITSQPGGTLYLSDTDTNNVNRIFSSRLSYNKGAMVLNMLRFKIGDTAFFQGLKNYLADPNLAFGYALTSDLQSHLETTSGTSLTEFFNDWVYKQGYPSYNIMANNLPGQIKFVVNQTQSHSSVSFFEMPLPIRLYGAEGQQIDLILQNTTNNQTFIENVPFVVTEVEFDPKKELISNGNSVSLSLKDFELQALKLYPNPASGIVNLKVPDGLLLKNIQVYNHLGQQVLSSQESPIDATPLSAGIYIVTVETDGGVRNLRFIRQ